MKKITESGHVKNAAQYGELAEYLKNMGSTYNPSNAQITISAIESQRSEIDGILVEVDKAEQLLRDAIRNRQNVFNKINNLSSKIVFALTSNDVDAQIIRDARNISRKILGSSKVKKKEAPPPEEAAVSDENTDKTAANLNEKPKSVRSTSQRSFDRRLNNFRKLCLLLATIPNYSPNENELQLTALNDLYTNANDLNIKAVQISNKMNDARNARDLLFYTGAKNAHETVIKVKNYIKSKYGFATKESKAVSKFKFKKMVK